jgi:hypothetical protein
LGSSNKWYFPYFSSITTSIPIWSIQNKLVYYYYRKHGTYSYVGIHFCLALGMTFNSWNNLQNITTLPTLLPLILFCTSIETEWFHDFLLMGYLLLFLFFYLSFFLSFNLTSIPGPERSIWRQLPSRFEQNTPVV